MARYSKTLTPAAEAAFLAGLRGGALVVAAAASAGVAVSTLYRRRRRDPGFDSAWRAAAEASSGWVYEKRPGESARLVRAARRLRFGGGRREAFLAALALSCHTRDSAREAGVHPSTVYRHLRRDPGFAGDNRAALALGYERLEALALAERAEAAERWARPVPPAAGVAPTSDFDEQMRLLDYWRRRDGSLGPRRVGRDRLKSTTFEAAMEALAKRMISLGLIPRAAAPAPSS